MEPNKGKKKIIHTSSGKQALIIIWQIDFCNDSINIYLDFIYFANLKKL